MLCLVYLPFVCSGPCSCRSERRVNNSVCSCHGWFGVLSYTHIGRCGLIVMYVYCACFTFSGEAGIAMGWQCSLWSSPVATVTYPSFFLSFSSSLWSFRASKKGQEANVRQWETVPDVPALHTFSLSTFLALPHPSVPLLFLPGIEDGTCGFEVADSWTSSADVLALPTFSLFPVLLSYSVSSYSLPP